MKISKDLQATVAANPHIEEVHFNANGDHYFNVHSHQEIDEKGKPKGKEEKYGRLSLQAVHVGNEGDRKIYKNKSIPVAETKIIKTMSREDILKAKVEGAEDADVKKENEELKKQLAEAQKKAAAGGGK